ncbi:hypothetical protein OBBRIDRAFT_810547 [Obba rivulosa]|uniref:Uncharacterized protein n=1 Tax=Obba rivulosa TaxID=1052685 RepID=A0A8E2DRD8_9APHY|nr:hypothetical protein OBBRIDRAFT_810547 [Obba rivulosa]
MRLQVQTGSTTEFYALRGATSQNSQRFDSGDLTPVSDPIARLTRECSALRLKLATAERRERLKQRGSSTAPSSALSPPTSSLSPSALHRSLVLGSTSSLRDVALSHAYFELMKLADRYKALEKTLHEVQESLRAKDKEIETLKKERDRLIAERDQEREKNRARSKSRTRDSRPAKREIHDREETSGHQRHREASRSKRQTRKTEDPPSFHLSPWIPTDAEEVARACSQDVFLTKTDNWSGAQIIQAVDDLNAEITQFAASATESCMFSRRAQAQLNPMKLGGVGTQEESAPWLGAAFSRILATQDHGQDPMWVQLALQASVATCCARSLSLFCVGFPSKLDALLTRILGYLQSTEPQATSAKWRSLTHRSVRMLYPGLEEYAVTELANTMMRWSNTVFTLSGSTSPADPPLSGRLRRIADAVFNLARITREEILSTAFEIMLIDSGDSFEKATMTNKMKEFDVESAGRTGDKVLCTTELGLRCVTRKNRSIGLGDRGEGEYEVRILLPPKVILDSAVEAVDR